MNGLAKLMVGLVAVFHLGAFALEAFLWMRPELHQRVLPSLNPGLTVSAADQAAVLRVLFINQGFYNLFLALGAIAGLILAGRGKASGVTLARYTCLVAVGAGLVLASTTHAYAGAAMQGGLAALALLLMSRAKAA